MGDARGTLPARETAGAMVSNKRQEECGEAGDEGRTEDWGTWKAKKRIRLGGVVESPGASSLNRKGSAARLLLRRKVPVVVCGQATAAVSFCVESFHDPSCRGVTADALPASVQAWGLRYVTMSRSGGISGVVLDNPRNVVASVPVVEEPPSEDDDRASPVTPTLASLPCSESSWSSWVMCDCTDACCASPVASEPGTSTGSPRPATLRPGDTRVGRKDVSCWGNLQVTSCACESQKALTVSSGALRSHVGESRPGETGRENIQRHTTPTAVEEPLSDYQEDVTADCEPA